MIACAQLLARIEREVLAGRLLEQSLEARRSARAARSASSSVSALDARAPPWPAPSACSKLELPRSRGRRCRTSARSGGRSPRRSARSPVLCAQPATDSSLRPRLRTVSSIPGIETRAPERTETSSGSSGVAEPLAGAAARAQPAPRRPPRSRPVRRLAARLHVGDAGLGRDREPARYPVGAEHPGHLGDPGALAAQAARAGRASPPRTPGSTSSRRRGRRRRAASLGRAAPRRACGSPRRSSRRPSSTAPPPESRRAPRGSPCAALDLLGRSGRRPRSAARSGPGEAPTCRRSRARARARGGLAQALERRRSAGRARRSPAGRRRGRRRAPRRGRSPSAVPPSGEGKPSETLMSAGPRISASRRGEASAISFDVAQPAGRLDQRLEADRPLAPGLGQHRLGALEVAGALDLGDDHRVEPLAGAGDRAHVVLEPGRRGAVDADADRRARPSRPSASASATAARASGFCVGRNRVLEVDDDLVGHQLRRLLELAGRARRDGQAGAPGPHPPRAYVLG